MLERDWDADEQWMAVITSKVRPNRTERIANAALAERRRLSELLEWRPIATAPKGVYSERITNPEWVAPPRILAAVDGELVITYWDWYYSPIGYGYDIDKSAWVDIENGGTLRVEPTHWLPIPEPPKAEATK